MFPILFCFSFHIFDPLKIYFLQALMSVINLDISHFAVCGSQVYLQS